MKNSDKFKTHFPDFSGEVYLYTDNSQTVNFIDVDGNTVEFTALVTLSCGCCSDVERITVNLDEFLDGLSDNDFVDLITDIIKNQNT